MSCIEIWLRARGRGSHRRGAGMFGPLQDWLQTLPQADPIRYVQYPSPLSSVNSN